MNGNVVGGAVVQGRDMKVIHLASHEVNWPVRVGVIPEQAAHYQHRNIADQLTHALSSFGTSVPRQILSGTGGIGKTQLAAHHARALAQITDPEEQLDLLVWANGSTRDRITFAYAQAAQQLYAAVPEDTEEAAQLFLTWLSNPNKHQLRRWLIVWDDLADPAAVRELWPPHDQACGRVLVTTRRRDHSLTHQGRHLLNVDVFTHGEACAFLSRSLDDAGIPHTTAEVEALAQDLGYLPLALGQAVVYMAELGMECTAYLELFHDRMRTLSEVFPDWDAPTPLSATWELSLQVANTHSPAGVPRPLLGLLALLDGSSVPERTLTAPPVLEYLTTHWLSKHTPTPSPTLDHQNVRAALTSLHRLNLITYTNPHTTNIFERTPKAPERLIGVHQLVQRATREHHQTRPTRHSVHALADALFHTWPEGEYDTSLTAQLRSNTRTLRSHSVHERSVEDWLWEAGGHPLLFQVGISLLESGNVGEAVAYWKDMTRTAHHYLGSDHSGAIFARSQLANSKGEAGDPSTAVRSLEDLLTDQIRVLGPDHPDTLSTRHNLATWQARSGDLTTAIQNLQNLLPETLRILDPDHPNTLIARNNLAHWKGEAGDTTGATQTFKDLLTDQIRVLGPDHPNTLTTRHNLAIRQGTIGDASGTALTFEDLLTDQIRVLGPDHPNTLITRSQLAHWKGEAGDTTGATQTFKDLLTDQIRVLGPDHPDTLTTRSQLAHWKGKDGDPSTTVTSFEDLLSDQIRVLGPDHPDTLTTRSQLAHWKGEAGDTTGATQTFKDLLTDQIRVLGPDHPNTLIARNNLALWKGEAGDTTGATQAFKDLLTDQIRVLGPDHPNTLATRHNLAVSIYDSGGAVKAIELLSVLIRDQARVFDPGHPHTQDSKQVLQIWQAGLTEE